MSEIELHELLERRHEVVLVDVRTRAEYSGEAGYPCDSRQGHIPGAVNAIVEGLPPDEVRALVGAPEGATVVAYCHSGARSSNALPWLAAAGYEALNYSASWHEWSSHDELEIETGL